jgi:hypothetical protein
MTDTRRRWLTAGGAVLVLVVAGLTTGMAGSTAAQTADIVVAADDSAEYTSIQNAVDNASDTARIEIEAGTYRQNVDVYKNVTIDAPNGATITNDSAIASHDGIKIAGNASPTVSGLTLTGWGNAINGYESTGDWAVVDTTITNVADGVDASYSSGDWQLTNTTIGSASEYGIVAVGTAGGQVVSASVIRESDRGISFSESTGDWRIEGTTIESTDSQGILTTDSAGDWVVTGTTIATTGRDGIVPYGSSGNWTVSSTTIRNSGDDGIDAYKSDTARIRDVTITNVSNEGIIIGDTDGDWIIEDTVVRQAGRIGINGEQLNASSDPIIRNTTVTGARRGIEMSNSQGDWRISDSTVTNIARSGVYASESMGGGTIQQLTVRNASDGIVFYNSSDDWTVADSTISRVSDNGLDVSYSSGDWQVRDTTIRNASRGGIVTVGSTGVPVIENAVIRDVVVGIDIKNATGDWTARNVSIQDAENVGIYANGTAGDWLVTESSLTNIGIVALQAGKTEGQWQINESIITNGNANATGARGADIEGNASYNYWGAADGPSGTLNGTGGKVRGNLKVTPFYTDASLTTLSSKIGNDSDSGSQNGSTGFVDVAASDLAGSGTAADPYIITNASELQAMEDDPAAHYELGTDIDASGTAEWNDGKGFVPINRFSGTLNGTGNTIDELTIDRPSEAGGGLINVLEENGEIVDIRVTSLKLTGDYNLGGLVGGSNAGLIKNSSVDGTITASGNDIGGLVAFNNGTIADSNFSGKISGDKSVGGIAGDNEIEGRIKDSYATGEVTAKNNNVGGITGGNGGVIRNSAATATVQGNLTDGFNAGGLVGINGKTDTEGTIESSFATGSVESHSYVGGLVGRNFNGTIEESYAAGTVKGSSVGGLVGVNGGTVTNSYWDTEATGQTDSDGSATGLSTEQMTGAAAETNMTGVAFGTTWETQPNDYPTLIETDVPTTTQVQLSNVQLRPAIVGSPDNHTLSLTLSGVSADGQTDTLSIRLPDSVTVLNVSNARSTDTGYDVSITSQRSPIAMTVNPDNAAGTVSLDVEATLQLKKDGI